MTGRAAALDASGLEALASSGDWPGFFAAIRDGGAALAGDVGGLNAAFRLARGRSRQDPVPGFRDVEVAVLRNATLEPWLPHAFAALVRRGLIPEFWLGDYATYEPYLTGAVPTWAEASPDVTLVYLDPEELVGDGAFLVDAKSSEAIRDRVESLLALLRDRAKGTVVVSNLTAPAHGFRDVYATQRRNSWVNLRRELNLRIVDVAEANGSLAVFDVDGLAARFGAARARDVGLYHTSHVPFSRDFMPVVADAFASVVAPAFVTPRKCVVLDADNTLWGGVLGEDGPDGLALGVEYPGSLYRRFHLYLKGLQEQGVLLALNSKNNEADVLDFLGSSSGTVLRADDFAARRINWGDKAANMRELAAELNIGLDSLIFIDDSSVECELIRSLLPEVQVEQFPADPLGIPAFIESLKGVEVLHVTDEDRRRAETMRSDARRERLKTEAGDLDTFIRSLEIRLEIRSQPADLVPRVAQLTQRTNQFNLTTRRYTEDEIRAFMEGDALVYTLAMSDRFSDYGTVGVAIVRLDGSDAEVDTLLLSCRAFGREIELAFVDRILRDLAARGVETVQAVYAATAKNAMVADFYERCGFETTASDDARAHFRLDLGALEPIGDSSRYTIETEGLG